MWGGGTPLNLFMNFGFGPPLKGPWAPLKGLLWGPVFHKLPNKARARVGGWEGGAHALLGTMGSLWVPLRSPLRDLLGPP